MKSKHVSGNSGKASDALSRPSGLGDDAYDVIFRMLMRRQLEPGAKVSVDALARELGVSQTPVREAMSRLEVQGLLVRRHLVGYSAAPQMDADRLRQLYDLRLLLEPHVAAEAARVMPADKIMELAELNANMSGVSSDDVDRYPQFAEWDSQFHDLIATGGGNDMIRDALKGIHIHAHLFRSCYHATATTDANHEHVRILDAIRDRDPDMAAQAMRRHIIASRGRFTAGL